MSEREYCGKVFAVYKRSSLIFSSFGGKEKIFYSLGTRWLLMPLPMPLVESDA
jgi:hypothetical protein